MEVISHIKVEISLFRVLTEAKLEESKWDKARYEQLNMTKEKRLKTVCHSQLYQGRLTRAFDTKVCPERFEVGNLVLEKFLPDQEDANGKWPQTIKSLHRQECILMTDSGLVRHR
ncbi:hypothetical protein Lal_00004221 [Lupinus albus]|nr:hypothetical protein Lal_00004221 [Lupinus albus]